MKKRVKGLISWWLVFAMIFSSVTVSFAAETAEVQSTNAEYYIGSDSLDSGYSVEYGESTYLKLYYGDGAATLTEQVSSLEKANRPENKILLGWKLWGMHYYGELHSGPREKTLTDVVTAEDIEICFEGDGYDDGDNYYDPLVEPHYVDKYIIDPQPTNETFTVGGKEYNIDDGEYYETTDVTYQWHLWETVPYTVVSTVEDETTEIAKSYTWKLTFSEGKWLTTANSTYSQISIAAQAGDIIDIKFDSEFSGTVRAYYSSGDYEYNTETQSYRYTVSEDRDVYAYIRPEDTSIQHTFTMSVLRSSVGESIVGETGATLTSGEDGNSYLCQLTFGQSDDAVVLYSDAVVWDEPEILHEHPICGAAECASHGSGVAYTAWDGTGTPSGNVYLTDNVTLTESLIISSGTVNLCLNGHTITITNSQDAFYVESGATLNICDCSTNQSGKIEKTSASADYPGILNRGGTVNVYSGTVSSSNNSNGIYNYSGTVNVYSGTVSSSQRYGINNKGTVNVYGGTVSGIYSGINNKGTVNVYGGTVSSSYSYGIYNDANLNIYGGTVSGISSGINNGADGEITVSGGTVTSEGDAGTGIYNYGEVTVSGGTVKSTGADGNNYGIYCNTGTLNLSGAPTITGLSVGIYLNNGCTITVGEGGLTNTSDKAISVYMITPGTFTSGWTEKMGENADYDSYFTAWDDGYTVQPDGSGELQLVEKPAHVCQWSYSINADHTDTVVATCIGEGECTSTVNKELTVIAPAHAEVNDSKEAAATLSATSIGGISELPDIVYYKYSQYPNIDESSATTTPFENVGGTYKAQITVGGVTAYTNYTVERLGRASIKQFAVSNVTVNSFVITLDEADRSKTDFVCQFGGETIEFTPDTNGRATITVPDVYAGSNNLWVFVYQKQTDIYKKSNTKDTTVSLKNPEYTVIFNANGGSGTMEDAYSPIGEEYTLPGCTFTAPSGMQFTGWDKGQPGDKITLSSDTTLIAQWQSIYKDYALLQNDIDHVREVLSGIAEVTEKDGTIVIKLTQDVMGRIRFDQNSGIFKLNLNGHTITPGTQNEALCLDNGFTGTVTVTGDGTLKKGVNNIIYNWKATLNFAVVEGKEYFSLKNGDSNIFSEKNTGTKEYTGTFTSSGDSFVLTQGMLGSYMVIFNASSGNGTMANQTIKELMPTTLSENTFTREGYTFAGWATSVNGTKVYDDKQSVTDIAAAGESITLFAVWNKIPAYAPTIISQPQGFEDANALTYANIGTDKKLSVETDADENEYIVAYQWYKNTTNSKDGAVAIGTEKDLAIENGLSAGDYYYYCKITVTRKDNGESTSVDTELVKVTVKVAANAIKGLAIEDWTYGESPKTPSASATFGTPAFTYVGTGETNYAENATPPANAGTYKVIAKVADTANYTGASDEKEFAIAKATPTYTAPVNLKATYGETLVDVTLPDGWSWKDSSLSVGNAGTNEFTAVFTPQDTTNFEVVEINVSVAVGKTIPSYDIPFDIEATYGDTLADVTLPDGWSWKDSTLSVGNAGTQTFVAVFTPSDTNNYNSVEENITITVAKKEVAEPAVSGSYTYTGNEQTVTLIGVESFMTVSGNKATNAGNYVVTITLDNNHRWNSTSDGEIAWSIAKAAPSLETPTAQNDITYGVLLSTVGLTEGWTWLDGTTIPTVQNSGFVACFTPADTANYDWTGIDGWNEVESRVEKTVSVTVTKADSSIAAAPTAILNLEYDGSAKALVNAGTANGGTMQYSLDGTTWSTDIPTRTDAGVYDVHYKVTGDANHNDNEGGTVQVTIAKAAPSLNAPEAITNLIYNGTTQSLTTNGTVAGGEIQFSTSENGTYAPAIITGENAGNYEVWYKIIGDNNHTDIAPVKLDISIAQKSVEGATVGTFVAMTYTGSEQTPVASVTIDGLTATGTWSNVRYVADTTTFTADGNFTGTIANRNAGMSKATPVVTAPAAKNNLVYNTSALVLTDAGSTTGGTMQYSLDNISWSNDIPSGTNAGDYTIYYRVVGNSNYNDVAAQSISVSIENADMSANITANGYNGVFDNQAHTISVAIPDGASIKYGTDDGTYELVAAPQYTNVETYKVYYKVEKANYNTVTGSADVVITAKDISNAEITLGEALTYTDSEQTRDFTVAPLDGLEIDYTVSGNTGKDAGVYTLTISGQGNFTGSKSVSWSIGKASQPAPETPAAVNETIKAKADGKITGVNSDMEYKLEGASEYIAISETEIANLAAGTYLVRYKENANHLAGADKQLIIADGAMITVSFNSNEGTAVDSITCEYNQAITAPAEPTKENFVFAGWYKDAECFELWNFGNTLTEDITLYAKWNDKPVYSVSGKVTDGESGLGGITVTLKQGNTIIATTTTAADGSYSFITEDGLYNIVAEKEENDNSTIKTVKIEVMESANVNDVVFVATDINSELEIKSDTPQIIVGGLDEEAQTVSSSNGNADVTVKMTVESTEDITGSDDATGQEQRQTEQKEIKKVSGNRYIQFIEINLTQSISGAESTKLEETSGLIEIIIPFEKGNKRNITVYRYHGSASEKLGAGIGNANADGEYFEVKENHIVVYAKKFSTYAIGYDLPSSGGGGSSVTRYTVKFDTNGGSSVSSATVTKNAKVAEPKTPEKDGYTFGGWYTDKEFAEKYDFESKVTKNFTLYAKWDKHDDEQSSTDTHNCPSLAFDDLDITKWYHFDTDYVIENGIFKGTTETTFEPDSAQTRAMMVTVLYRVEGEPAVNRSIPFADVDMGAYYANAVIWGQQNGIIKGYSETEFGPDDKITREQIAAIMHRYAQYKGYDVSVGENTNILSYDDFDSISEYAIHSMQWAVGSGMIKGKSESTLNPLDNATRAEIAAILHRFIEAN